MFTETAAIKEKLIALAAQKIRKVWRLRRIGEADLAAIRGVTGWRRHWYIYLQRRRTHYKVHPVLLETAGSFNTPDTTNNNPFHAPLIMWAELEKVYIDQWQRYWFKTPTRHRIVWEALCRERERKRARGRRVAYLSRDDIYLLQDCRCQICGRFVARKKFHLDHRQPVSRGGKHVPSNVQVSCPHCNLVKGNRS